MTFRKKKGQAAQEEFINKGIKAASKELFEVWLAGVPKKEKPVKPGLKMDHLQESAKNVCVL